MAIIDERRLTSEAAESGAAAESGGPNRAARRGHLSPEQLAEREGVPVTTIYQWRSRRTGPPGFKVGRHVRYRLADVIAWEERQIAADQHGVA